VSRSVGASFSFLGVEGEGGVGQESGGVFQVVFGVRSGLFIVHFLLGQFELFVI
jgi:hypothetical protein